MVALRAANRHPQGSCCHFSSRRVGRRGPSADEPSAVPFFIDVFDDNDPDDQQEGSIAGCGRLLMLLWHFLGDS